ncbi:asparagine--tRNA ligase [Patescibacteria group bacterium]|nr:asparagine--tRNA ligase [Patescibacteria group bacterium]
MANILLKDIEQYLEEEITISGWVNNVRSSGKILFIQFRDGTGSLQAVVDQKEVGAAVFDSAKTFTNESSISLTGQAKAEPRSPSGYEMLVKNLEIIQVAEDFPIGKKEHGPEFLMDNRHLWLRSPKQAAILKIRDEIVFAMREFFRQEGFTLTDSPILTPTSCEGSTTLFKTDYFGEDAYLSQSGQLYLEATIYSLGRVYDFGPTFRAEKSKTRRHLIEFWMLDAEAAFVEFEENLEIQEKLVSYLVDKVLTNRKKELEILERDTKLLAKVKPPFPRLRYDEVVAKQKIKWGDDLGAEEETEISQVYDKPVFITHYPAQTKSFYMQPDPEDQKYVLNSDLIAPEGYGEIVGGSQRIHDYKLLEQKIKEFKMPIDDYRWYLDLRRYGSVPHSGFGIGLERTVAWICGLSHVRETIPFARLLNRLRP